MRSLLAEYVVSDPDVPDSYSLRLEHEAAGVNDWAHPLPRLYRGTCITVRDRDPERILQALCVQLDVHRTAGTAEALVLPGIALLHDDGALIVPATWEQAVGTGERRLAEAGVELVPAPAVLLQAGTGALMVPGPGLAVDESVLSAPIAPRTLGGQLLRPVRTWLVRAQSRPALDPVPRSEAVATALRWAENVELLGTALALETVVTLAGDAECLSGRNIGAADIVPTLLTLARR